MSTCRCPWVRRGIRTEAERAFDRARRLCRTYILGSLSAGRSFLDSGRAKNPRRVEGRDPWTPVCPRAAFQGWLCHPVPPGSCLPPRVADLRGPDVPACISGVLPQHTPPARCGLAPFMLGPGHDLGRAQGTRMNSLPSKIKHQVSLWLLPHPAELRRPQATLSDGGAERVCREDRPTCFSGDGTVAIEELNRPTDNLAGKLGEVGCRITQVCAIQFVNTGGTKQKRGQNKMPFTAGSKSSKYPGVSLAEGRVSVSGSLEDTLSLQPDFTSDEVPSCSTRGPGVGDR